MFVTDDAPTLVGMLSGRSGRKYLRLPAGALKASPSGKRKKPVCMLYVRQAPPSPSPASKATPSGKLKKLVCLWTCDKRARARVFTCHNISNTSDRQHFHCATDFFKLLKLFYMLCSAIQSVIGWEMSVI